MSRGNHKNRKGLFSSKGAGANVIDQSIDVRAEAIAAIASCAARFARRREIRHRCAAYSEQHAQ